MASNSQIAHHSLGLNNFLIGSALLLVIVWAKLQGAFRNSSEFKDSDSDDEDDSPCSDINSSQVAINTIPPDSRTDPDRNRWTLAQCRTTEDNGRLRSGLVPPPVWGGGRFRYENVHLGGNVAGLSYERTAVCPRAPRLVVLDGIENGLEGMEDLSL